MSSVIPVLLSGGAGVGRPVEAVVGDDSDRREARSCSGVVSVWGFAQAVIASAATVTALGVLARWGPVRWVFRRLVGDPLRTWFRSEVAAVVDERLDARPLTNGKGWKVMQAVADHLGIEIDE